MHQPLKGVLLLAYRQRRDATRAATGANRLHVAGKTSNTRTLKQGRENTGSTLLTLWLLGDNSADKKIWGLFQRVKECEQKKGSRETMADCHTSSFQVPREALPAVTREGGSWGSTALGTRGGREFSCDQEKGKKKNKRIISDNIKALYPTVL
jgi:hypothetical protein